ncbi:hypothetical protein EGT74_22100 [Chitinophaga lutea]|uniref:Uncharacterized protein n=1 Tax=Chitinophaga lutea TaxID=2488634 RepID=A0A3N4PLW4_9BACT|nr:hypothetical protein EGT74_22100 [Chitinophaga lutea]
MAFNTLADLTVFDRRITQGSQEGGRFQLLLCVYLLDYHLFVIKPFQQVPAAMAYGAFLDFYAAIIDYLCGP